MCVYIVLLRTEIFYWPWCETESDPVHKHNYYCIALSSCPKLVEMKHWTGWFVKQTDLILKKSVYARVHVSPCNKFLDSNNLRKDWGRKNKIMYQSNRDSRIIIPRTRIITVHTLLYLTLKTFNSFSIILTLINNICPQARTHDCHLNLKAKTVISCFRIS